MEFPLFLVQPEPRILVSQESAAPSPYVTTRKLRTTTSSRRQLMATNDVINEIILSEGLSQLMNDHRRWVREALERVERSTAGAIDPPGSLK